MMMIRVLFWLMAVGAVIGCQAENTEPTSGTLNVDPNSEEEVPEWVTARYLDLNRDGTIDIKDLVIMSKFFGQDVPEGEVASASDGADPCQAISDLDINAIAFDPEIGTVEDNEEYKEIFNAPNGNSYVYALLAPMLQVSSDDEFYAKSREDRAKELLPPCLAMRFTVDNKQMVKELKIKRAGGHKKFSETITSLPLVIRDMYSISNMSRPSTDVPCPNNIDIRTAVYDRGCSEYEDGTHIWAGAGRRSFYDNQVFYDPSVKVHTVTDTYPRSAGNEDLWDKYNHAIKRRGIPIGNDNVIREIIFYITRKKGQFAPAKCPNSFSCQLDRQDTVIINGWRITHKEPKISRFSAEERGAPDRMFGAYLKMLPSEVRRRYFREDIEATD